VLVVVVRRRHTPVVERHCFTSVRATLLIEHSDSTGGFSYLGLPLKLVDSFRFLLKLDENTRQFHDDQVLLAVTGVL
jgi:hypothetical protein